MKIYLVWRELEWEEDFLLGAFSKEEYAEEYIGGIPSGRSVMTHWERLNSDGYNFYVQVKEVIK